LLFPCQLPIKIPKQINTPFNKVINMAKQKTERRFKGDGLFIPAGLFLGMGAGFLIDQLVAGMFLGLGAGFFAMAMYKVTAK
jgi:hypothetical protein